MVGGVQQVVGAVSSCMLWFMVVLVVWGCIVRGAPVELPIPGGLCNAENRDPCVTFPDLCSAGGGRCVAKAPCEYQCVCPPDGRVGRDCTSSSNPQPGTMVDTLLIFPKDIFLDVNHVAKSQDFIGPNLVTTTQATTLATVQTVATTWRETQSMQETATTPSKTPSVQETATTPSKTPSPQETATTPSKTPSLQETATTPSKTPLLQETATTPSKSKSASLALVQPSSSGVLSSESPAREATTAPNTPRNSDVIDVGLIQLGHGVAPAVSLTSPNESSTSSPDGFTPISRPGQQGEGQNVSTTQATPLSVPLQSAGTTTPPSMAEVKSEQPPVASDTQTAAYTARDLHSTTVTSAGDLHSTTVTSAGDLHSTTVTSAGDLHSTTATSAGSLHPTTATSAGDLHLTTAATAQPMNSTPKELNQVNHPHDLVVSPTHSSSADLRQTPQPVTPPSPTATTSSPQRVTIPGNSSSQTDAPKTLSSSDPPQSSTTPNLQTTTSSQTPDTTVAPHLVTMTTTSSQTTPDTTVAPHLLTMTANSSQTPDTTVTPHLVTMTTTSQHIPASPSPSNHSNSFPQSQGSEEFPTLFKVTLDNSLPQSEVGVNAPLSRVVHRVFVPRERFEMVMRSGQR